MLLFQNGIIQHRAWPPGSNNGMHSFPFQYISDCRNQHAGDISCRIEKTSNHSIFYNIHVIQGKDRNIRVRTKHPVSIGADNRTISLLVQKNP